MREGLTCKSAQDTVPISTFDIVEPRYLSIYGSEGWGFESLRAHFWNGLLAAETRLAGRFLVFTVDVVVLRWCSSDENVFSDE
jgi:hypothetical protein